MTRKDYINIAAAILATQTRIKTEAQRQMEHYQPTGNASFCHDIETEMNSQLRGVRRAAAHLADFLASDNPRFNQARFLMACGYGGVNIINTHAENNRGNGIRIES